jgi:protein O-GlcNAc transferase
MGLSILKTLGLEELIAYTPEEYVEICVKLANDLNYLQQLRMEMRERMLSSPLMDGQAFTRELEFYYRTMWHKWCQS